MRTGMIGLGTMGGAMAQHLERAGLLVAAWNRTKARAVGLLQDEALLLDKAEDVAAKSELLLLSLSRDSDVEEIVQRALPHLRAGSLVVDTSTVSANTAVKLAAMLAEKKVDFLDCPVSGGAEGARNATLSIMVGGEAQALAKARPALEALSSRIVHIGGVGAGQATKSVNQIMGAGINHAVTEALAFGRAYGLDMDKVMEAVSAGASANWFLQHRGGSMLQGDYKPGFRVSLHAKDLRIARDLAAGVGMSLPVVEKTLLDYDSLEQRGCGDEDISALFRLKSGEGDDSGR